MAKRPSTQEILEAARRGGAAKPSTETPAPAPAPEPAPAAASEAPAPASAPVAGAEAPTPASLGRPLTLKEKLAAARAGGGPAPAAPAKPAAPAAAAPAAAAEAAPAPDAPQSAPAAPAAPLGRPMTLAEKLAAARGGGAKPAAGAAAKAGAAPAAAKPAATAAAAARTLPPLEKMTDPKDLAEAARRTAAERARADQAAKKPAAAAKPAAKAKPQTVPPKPGRGLADAPYGAQEEVTLRFSRRGLAVGTLMIAWLAIAWTTFAAALSAMTVMVVRFMFPNVLAEPPSTIKIGLPSNFDPESVSDRFKAEWGFWVVRSNYYSGQDIIYALQSVCTHLGCPPNWLASEQKFKCPCHGSGYYISGVNFEGPAPRPLERFKVVVADDGQLVVDKSQHFQQELGQWTDPDSYVPA